MGSFAGVQLASRSVRE